MLIFRGVWAFGFCMVISETISSMSHMCLFVYNCFRYSWVNFTNASLVGELTKRCANICTCPICRLLKSLPKIAEPVLLIKFHVWNPHVPYQTLTMIYMIIHMSQVLSSDTSQMPNGKHHFFGRKPQALWCYFNIYCDFSHIFTTRCCHAKNAISQCLGI